MALVGFGCEQQLQGHVGRRGRVVQQCVWAIVRGNVGPQLSQNLCWTVSVRVRVRAGRWRTLLLVLVVLLGDIVVGGGRGGVGSGVNRGHRLLEICVELGFERLDLLQTVVGRGFDGVDVGGEKSAQWLGRALCERPGAYGCKSAMVLSLVWTQLEQQYTHTASRGDTPQYHGVPTSCSRRPSVPKSLEPCAACQGQSCARPKQARCIESACLSTQSEDPLQAPPGSEAEGVTMAARAAQGHRAAVEPASVPPGRAGQDGIGQDGSGQVRARLTGRVWDLWDCHMS